ncbi:uncharacterized protein [Antedon mediterranea]|uniref:uncharacterized protein n=1 Tax=Antedon mediterranea TaxID=105859 RepID=UPI003AF80763
MYEKAVAREMVKQVKGKQNTTAASTENASDNKNSMIQEEGATASAKQASGNENAPTKYVEENKIEEQSKENPAQSTKIEESKMDEEQENLQTKIPSKIEIEKEESDDQTKIPSKIEELIEIEFQKEGNDDKTKIEKEESDDQTKIPSKIEELIEIEFQKEGNDDKTTSDKFVMNISDFGGQPIYHVMQRIFMVSFAVICVVFNLCDDLDAPAKVLDPTSGQTYPHRMTNLEFILSWIRSIYTNSRPDAKINGQPCPPVLLIGTHLNGLKGTEEEKKCKLAEIKKRIWQALKDKPYAAMVCSTIFTIENSVPFAQSNASVIMKHILEFSKKMIRTLPIKWLRGQQEIQSLKKEHIYLQVSKVHILLKDCEDTENQRFLLEYLHDIVEILYYPDDEALRDIIVIDLMKLVDMSKTFITVKEPENMEPVMWKAWQRLDTGILEVGLLKYLWKEFCDSDETFNFFVSLMEKFGLMCASKKKDEHIFYVLSRLKPEPPPQPQFEDKRAISLFHDFGSYLPDDLFQRAATKFIEKFQMEDVEPRLSYEHVELNIDAEHLVILYVATIKHCRMLQTTIVRTKSIKADSSLEDDIKPLPEVCKKVLHFLQKELKVFSQKDARGLEVRMYIPCASSPNIQNAHMHLIRKFDQDVLPCGSNQMEVKLYRKLFGEAVLPKETLKSQDETIPSRSHNEGYVDDQIIRKVSEEIHNWKLFGVHLGLSSLTVTKFGSELITSTKEMMNFWRTNIDIQWNQLEVFCIALIQHGSNNLADMFQKDIVEKRYEIQLAGSSYKSTEKQQKPFTFFASEPGEEEKEK